MAEIDVPELLALIGLSSDAIAALQDEDLCTLDVLLVAPHDFITEVLGDPGLTAGVVQLCELYRVLMSASLSALLPRLVRAGVTGLPYLQSKVQERTALRQAGFKLGEISRLAAVADGYKPAQDRKPFSAPGTPPTGTLPTLTLLHVVKDPEQDFFVEKVVLHQEGLLTLCDAYARRAATRKYLAVVQLNHHAVEPVGLYGDPSMLSKYLRSVGAEVDPALEDPETPLLLAHPAGKIIYLCLWLPKRAERLEPGKVDPTCLVFVRTLFHLSRVVFCFLSDIHLSSPVSLPTAGLSEQALYRRVTATEPESVESLAPQFSAQSLHLGENDRVLQCNSLHLPGFLVTHKTFERKLYPVNMTADSLAGFCETHRVKWLLPLPDVLLLADFLLGPESVAPVKELIQAKETVASRFWANCQFLNRLGREARQQINAPLGEILDQKGDCLQLQTAEERFSYEDIKRACYFTEYRKRSWLGVDVPHTYFPRLPVEKLESSWAEAAKDSAMRQIYSITVSYNSLIKQHQEILLGKISQHINASEAPDDPLFNVHECYLRDGSVTISGKCERFVDCCSYSFHQISLNKFPRGQDWISEGCPIRPGIHKILHTTPFPTALKVSAAYCTQGKKVIVVVAENDNCEIKVLMRDHCESLSAIKGGGQFHSVAFMELGEYVWVAISVPSKGEIFVYCFDKTLRPMGPTRAVGIPCFGITQTLHFIPDQCALLVHIEADATPTLHIMRKEGGATHSVLKSEKLKFLPKLDYVAPGSFGFSIKPSPTGNSVTPVVFHTGVQLPEISLPLSDSPYTGVSTFAMDYHRTGVIFIWQYDINCQQIVCLPLRLKGSSVMKLSQRETAGHTAGFFTSNPLFWIPCAFERFPTESRLGLPSRPGFPDYFEVVAVVSDASPSYMNACHEIPNYMASWLKILVKIAKGKDVPIQIAAVPFSAAGPASTSEAYCPVPLGDWVRSMICCVPLQVARAESNSLVLLPDGLRQLGASSPRSTAEKTAVETIRSFRMGMLDAVLASWDGPVKVVSSMGRQSTGKSYTLNHLGGTFFAVSGDRCTDGIWVGAQIGSSGPGTQSCLYVLLDFEGLCSAERDEQEDMLLSIVSAAVSNIAILKSNMHLDKHIQQIMQKAKDAPSRKFGNNPKLFRGRLVVCVNDVVSDAHSVEEHFSEAIQRGCGAGDSPFLDSLFQGCYVIIAFPCLTDVRYYEQLEQLKEVNLDTLESQFSSGFEFLEEFRLVLALTTIGVFKDVSTHRLEVRLAQLREDLQTAIVYGALCPQCPAWHPLMVDGRPLDDNYTDIGVVLDPNCAGSTLLNEFSVPTMPAEAWRERRKQHISTAFERRKVRVVRWIEGTLFSWRHEGDVEHLLEDVNNKFDEYRKLWALCDVHCDKCQYTCNYLGYHTTHSCLIPSCPACPNTCSLCPELCGQPAGHPLAHMCSDSAHLCGKECNYSKLEGCSMRCTLPTGHVATDPHHCGSPHRCTEMCQKPLCGGRCYFPVEEEHTHMCQQICGIQCAMSRPNPEEDYEKPIICPRSCEKPHLHELDGDFRHQCPSEHLCPKMCDGPGTCHMAYKTEKKEAKFRSGPIAFQARTQGFALKKPCCFKLPPFATDHLPPHVHKLQAVHTCDARCPQCRFLCELPFGHDGLHNTQHGNMNECCFVSAGANKITVGQNLFFVGESGKTQFCDAWCRHRGRGHYHVVDCESHSGSECRFREPEDGRVHSTVEWHPTPKKPRDLVSHERFWRDQNWADPISPAEPLFNLCSAYCPHPDHGCAHEFCHLSLMHPPVAAAPKTGARGGHKFACIHRTTFHFFFLLDRSGSMRHRWGAVVKALQEFLTIRAQDTESTDLVTIMVFNGSTDVLVDGATVTPQLADCLTQIKPSGDTDFVVAVDTLQALVTTSCSSINTPVLVFLTDGAEKGLISDKFPTLVDIFGKYLSVGYSITEIDSVVMSLRTAFVQSNHKLRAFFIGIGDITPPCRKLLQLMAEAAGSKDNFRVSLDGGLVETFADISAAVSPHAVMDLEVIGQNGLVSRVADSSQPASCGPGSDIPWTRVFTRLMESTRVSKLLEALSSLQHLVYDIVPVAKSCLDWAASSFPQLDGDFVAAIRLYTLQWSSWGSLFTVISQALSSSTRSNLELKPYTKYIKLLITALESLPDRYRFSGQAWRGVRWRFPTPDHPRVKDHFHVGRIFRWYTFASTSLSPEVLRSQCFCGSDGPRTVFRIEIKKGFLIHEFSAYPEERECLLLPLTQFEVVEAVPEYPNESIVQNKPDFVALKQV
eukprot:TRINITY_DN6321_c0_g1_i1.p1 TRINITY_DN6321_c0_g1~~TRINITY_DN6321_c0_g1_i1.p1  ORF type:complete len:2269 (+),score=240.26 TRINITY_DN6321_c0_g1_i1:448-7254(+)